MCSRRASLAVSIRCPRSSWSGCGPGIPSGEASSRDFQTFELLRIVERFATGFDDLPELIAGRSEYRVLVAEGTLVYGFAVVGQLASDGAVELVQLDVDRQSPW